MIFYSFRIFRNLFCQSFQICECKDKNFFPIYKTFFEVFFQSSLLPLLRYNSLFSNHFCVGKTNKFY